jgi:hypothetical protein
VSAPSPASRASTAILGASIASALALFVALPPEGARLPSFFVFVGRFHTLALHLPVGVLLLIACAELLTRSSRLRARIDPALDLALPFVVLTAVSAFALGLLLARGGGYPPRLLALHRGFTLGAVLGTTACLVAWERRRRSGAEQRLPYRVALAASVALLVVGAHFGGSMTRGDGYLTRYAPAFVQALLGAPPIAPSAPTGSGDAREPLVLADVLLPMLRRACVECHGPDKRKGGLRLDSLAAILAGGENGPVVLPGRGAESPLIKRLLLPSSEDEHMPPASKPQLASGELEALRWWIDRGATATLRVKDVLVPDGARTIFARTLDGAGEPAAPSAAVPERATLGAAAASGARALSTRTQGDTPSTAAPATTTPPDARLAYRDDIAPLLAARCGKCHGEAKQKGKLRVDSLAALLTGGKSGAGVVPGDGARGAVLARLRLPIDDDKHMPPREVPPLSPSQVAMLSAWVARGASETMLASGLPLAADAAPRRSSAPPEATAATTSQPSLDAPLTVPPGHVALFRDVVAPILARRCGECHLGAHHEGGMRLDDLAALVRSGRLVVGKPAASPVVTRMALPATDADRMPPPEKPPAEAWETAAIAAWVAHGAAADTVVAASDLPPAVARAMERAASTLASDATATPTSSTPPPASPPPGAIAPLRAGGCGACTVGSLPGPPARPLAATALLTLTLVARRRRVFRPSRTRRSPRDRAPRREPG